MIKTITKLFKPSAPKTLEDILREGAVIQWNFPDRDIEGKLITVDPVEQARKRKQARIAEAHRRLQECPALIAAAAKLPSAAELERELDAAKAELTRLTRELELIRRRFFGGVVEMPDVARADAAFNDQHSNVRRIADALAVRQRADEAHADYNRLRKELAV